MLKHLGYWQKLTKILTPARVAILFSCFFSVILLKKNGHKLVPQETCSRMFDSGIYDRNVTLRKHGTGLWRPDGCDVRYRTLNETVSCLVALTEQNKNAPFLIFAGDSRIRQLRDQFVYQVTGHDFDGVANPALVVDPVAYKKHEPRGDFYPTASVHIRFEWLPYLDTGEGDMTKFIARTLKAEFRPTLLVMGAGVWTVRDCSRAKRPQEACAEEYKQNFLKLLPLLEELSKTTIIVWVPQGVINEKLLRHPDDIKVGFNNDNMELYNRVIQAALDSVPGHHITYWNSSWQTSVELYDGLDGLHYGMQGKRHMLQMLINRICRPVELSRPIVWSDLKENYCCEHILHRFWQPGE